MHAVYQHIMLDGLCAESGITVAQLADAGDLPVDAINDLGCLRAVEPGDGDTPERYLWRVLDAVAAGDVAATLALRRLFGLPPFA